MGSRPIIVKRWSHAFSLKDEILRVVPIWVQFPNLPLNCWVVQTLSNIVSVIGLPLYADKCPSKQQRFSFASVLVEVDLTKPLHKNVTIGGRDGVLNMR